MTFWVFHLNSWPKLAEIPSMVLHDVVLSENTWRIWRDREIQGMSAHFRGLSIHYPDTWAFHCHPYPDYWKIAIHHILSFKERREKNVFSRGLYSVNLEGHTIVESRKQKKISLQHSLEFLYLLLERQKFGCSSIQRRWDSYSRFPS